MNTAPPRFPGGPGPQGASFGAPSGGAPPAGSFSQAPGSFAQAPPGAFAQAPPGSFARPPVVAAPSGGAPSWGAPSAGAPASVSAASMFGGSGGGAPAFGGAPPSAMPPQQQQRVPSLHAPTAPPPQQHTQAPPPPHIQPPQQRASLPSQPAQFMPPGAPFAPLTAPTPAPAQQQQQQAQNQPPGAWGGTPASSAPVSPHAPAVTPVVSSILSSAGVHLGAAGPAGRPVSQQPSAQPVRLGGSGGDAAAAAAAPAPPQAPPQWPPFAPPPVAGAGASAFAGAAPGSAAPAVGAASAFALSSGSAPVGGSSAAAFAAPPFAAKVPPAAANAAGAAAAAGVGGVTSAFSGPRGSVVGSAAVGGAFGSAPPGMLAAAMPGSSSFAQQRPPAQLPFAAPAQAAPPQWGQPPAQQQQRVEGAAPEADEATPSFGAARQPAYTAPAALSALMRQQGASGATPWQQQAEAIAEASAWQPPAKVDGPSAPPPAAPSRAGPPQPPFAGGAGPQQRFGPPPTAVGASGAAAAPGPPQLPQQQQRGMPLAPPPFAAPPQQQQQQQQRSGPPSAPFGMTQQQQGPPLHQGPPTQQGPLMPHGGPPVQQGPPMQRGPLMPHGGPPLQQGPPMQQGPPLQQGGAAMLRSGYPAPPPPMQQSMGGVPAAPGPPPPPGPFTTATLGSSSGGGGGGGSSGGGTPSMASPPVKTPTGTPQRIDPLQIPRPRYSHPSAPIRYNTTDGAVHVPPPAWADYTAEDTGNCNPRFMRCTVGYVPCTKEVLKESKLPLAVVVTPLASLAVHLGELPLACIDFGAEGPPRCARCRGYLNPWVKWTDAGRSWLCNLCGASNETPAAYQGPLDMVGQRRDRAQRPELCCGSVEFLAPPSYLLRPAVPACYAVVVDVSFGAVASGATAAAIASVRASLDVLLAMTLSRIGSGGDPVAVAPRLGIVTFDSAVHFWDISPHRGGADAAQVVAGDVEDAFCPLALSHWCLPVADARTRDRLSALLDFIAKLFPATSARPVQSAAGAAVKAAIDGLAETGGRVTLFQGALATAGEGALPPRESLKLYGTDREKELFTPVSASASASSPAPAATWYAELGRAAALRGVCVDIVGLSSSWLDLGTAGQLCSLTGGTLRLYSSFTAPLGLPPAGQTAPPPGLPSNVIEKVVQEYVAALSLESGTDGVLKLRVSPGLRVLKYMGNFSEHADSEADLAGCDADKSLVLTLQHDGNEVKDSSHLFLQAALLYTNSAGSRRIRVHNLRLVATESIQETFRHADIDATLSILLRKAVVTATSKDVRFLSADMVESATEMLLSYRRHCAANSAQGQLILPESLKLLPLYLSAATKLPAFVVNKPQPRAVPGRNPYADVHVRADRRAADLCAVMSLPPHRIVPLLYPRVYRVDALADAVGVPTRGGLLPDAPGPFASNAAAAAHLAPEALLSVPLPPQTFPSVEQLAPAGVFLLESPQGLYVIIGAEVDDAVVEDLLGRGAPAAAALPPGLTLPLLPTEYSARLWTVIAALRARRPPHLALTVVVPADAAGRAEILDLLTEDRTPHGGSGARSYVDLLCHVHTSIQQRLQQA